MFGIDDFRPETPPAVDSANSSLRKTTESGAMEASGNPISSSQKEEDVVMKSEVSFLDSPIVVHSNCKSLCRRCITTHCGAKKTVMKSTNSEHSLTRCLQEEQSLARTKAFEGLA